ncbi:hypothetical protein SAMN05421750_1237, partial [Agrobacterium pusense]
GLHSAGAPDDRRRLAEPVWVSNWTLDTLGKMGP